MLRNTNALDAQAYVSRLSDALLRERENHGIYLLNFDGPGVDGDLCLVGGNSSFLQPSKPNLSRWIKEPCAELRIPLREIPLPDALLDHMPFAQADSDAGSLIGIGKTSLSVHTRRDRFYQLRPRGFEHAENVAVRVLEKLASQVS